VALHTRGPALGVDVAWDALDPVAELSCLADIPALAAVLLVYLGALPVAAELPALTLHR